MMIPFNTTRARVGDTIKHYSGACYMVDKVVNGMVEVVSPYGKRAIVGHGAIDPMDFTLVEFTGNYSPVGSLSNLY